MVKNQVGCRSKEASRWIRSLCRGSAKTTGRPASRIEHVTRGQSDWQRWRTEARQDPQRSQVDRSSVDRATSNDQGESEKTLSRQEVQAQGSATTQNTSHSSTHVTQGERGATEEDSTTSMGLSRAHLRRESLTREKDARFSCDRNEINLRRRRRRRKDFDTIDKERSVYLL